MSTKWSEKARLQVIEAVMKVESEILNGSPGKSVHANCKGSSKWDRIAKLLPRYMQGRTWNHTTGKYNQYKCSRVFYSLLRGYKRIASQANVRSFHHVTEPEFRLIKKREELLKAGKGLESGRLNNNPEDSPDLQSSDSGNEQGASSNEQGASSLAERTNDSGSLECYEKLPQLDNDMEAVRRDDSDDDLYEESGPEGQERYVDQGDRDHTPNESDRLEWREVNRSEFEGIFHIGPEKFLEGLASRPTLGSGSRSSESDTQEVFVDEEMLRNVTKAKPVARTRVETQALTRPKGRGSNTATRRPARQSRTSKAERQSTASMTQPTSGEDLNAILERPLKCLDLEFAYLSSWVKSEAIPVGRELVNELTSSAPRSGKRRKLNATNPPGTVTAPFDGLMNKSSVGVIDSRIRALFHKLRIRFAEELKKTCEDIAREVTEGA